MSKVANIATVKPSNVQKKTPDEVQNQKKNGSPTTKGPADGSSRTSPAFQGAKFDKRGYCLKHPSVQLVKPKKDGAGRIVYQELRTSCSSCQSDKHKSKRGTSSSGGKAPADHRGRGARGPPSRSRSKSRGRGEGGPERARARSRSRGGRPRREYDTPFDEKGRCHYHVNVQLAAKKMTGGWKVLQAACPKCMDEGTGGGDDRSVRSGASRASRRGGGDDRSVRSGASRDTRRGGAGSDGDGDARGQYDDNGCCARHPHIQIAKKKLFGAGFKVVRDCPKCGGGDVAADDYSVKSGRSARSARSASSRKSRRSAKAAPRGRPGAATRSGRYGALPFDADGFCCQHPSVQLAKKKALGGFKILHHVCPECQADDRGDAGSVASSASKVSSLSRNGGGGSSAAKKKRVRNLRTEDEEGRHGRYTGYVNSEHQPHGDGTMKYADGSSYAGVWSEGSKVHGKTTKKKAQ